MDIPRLLLILVNWLKQWQRQIQKQEDQKERDFSEDSPSAWFDSEFNSGGRVQQYVPPETRRTDKANTD